MRAPAVTGTLPRPADDPRRPAHLSLLLFAVAALFSLSGAAAPAAFAAPGPGLRLAAERRAATDLAVTGLMPDAPRGSTRYLAWADLAALPRTRLKIAGEFGPGEREVAVVFLADFWAALPRDKSSDTLLATCADGYASVFRADFIRDYRPFLVVEIDGRGPGEWPPPGLKMNPGPYVIGVSAAVVPAVADLVDAGHKRPWRITGLEIARFSERFAGFYRGPWARPSAAVVAGRELWLGACASCHTGPADTFGGTKGDRPFELMAAHAAHNAPYLTLYVRNPTDFVPTAKMQPHPHYSDRQLDELVAFLALAAPK